MKYALPMLAACSLFSGAMLSAQMTVTPLEELSGKQVQQVFSQENTHHVLEIPAGTELPLSVSLKGDLLSIVETAEKPLLLTVKERLFLRFTKEDVLVSSDLSTWVPFQTFVTGTVGFSVGEHDGEQSFTLYGELNKRK